MLLPGSRLQAWGVDYVKSDSCSEPRGDFPLEQEQFKLMRDGLNATGRAIFWNLCSVYIEDGTIGNSWRIANDNNAWGNVVNAMNCNAGLNRRAGPGGWNDPDTLIGSTPPAAALVTPAQSRLQFSMWAVMASPMLIGAHMTGLSDHDLETFSNADVITVNQDRLGIQGVRVSGAGLAHAGGNCGGGPTAAGTDVINVWARPLSGGRIAVALLNVGADDATISCDAGCFSAIGSLTGVAGAAPDGTCYTIKNLWAAKDEGDVLAGHLARTVPGNNGTVVLLLLTPRSGAANAAGGGGCPAPVVPASPAAMPGPKPFRPAAPTPPPPPPAPHGQSLGLATCDPSDPAQVWGFHATTGALAAHNGSSEWCVTTSKPGDPVWLAPCGKTTAGWHLNATMGGHIQSDGTVACTVEQQKGQRCFLCFDTGGAPLTLWDCKRPLDVKGGHDSPQAQEFGFDAGTGALASVSHKGLCVTA